MNDLLKPLQLPDLPGIWPLAPGWWLVLGLSVVFSAGTLWLWRRRNWAKRAALKELSLIEKSSLGESELCLAVSSLLKRYLMQKFPRQKIASLEDKAWLSFLDQHGGKGWFQSQGQDFTILAYGGKGQIDTQLLIQRARSVIRARFPRARPNPGPRVPLPG